MAYIHSETRCSKNIGYCFEVPRGERHQDVDAKRANPDIIPLLLICKPHLHITHKLHSVVDTQFLKNIVLVSLHRSL